MRLRRLSFVAGWAAVALLAMAGLAAFGSPSPTSEEVQVEAASASMGHTSGAYAGLAFALIGPPGSEALSIDLTDDLIIPDLAVLSQTSTDAIDGADGNSADTSASGWLSEVEVRALVGLYFEPSDVNQAVRIAWCESRFDPNSVNRTSGAIGLFQHLPRYWPDRSANAGFPGAEPTDAEASTAAAAWAVYNGGGWDTFSCRG